MLFLSSLLIFSCVKLAFTQEFVIYTNELTDVEKVAAVGIVTLEHKALAEQKFAAIRQNITEHFNRFYGGKWNCFVGSKETIETILIGNSAAPNTTLWFSYNTTHVLIYKTTFCQTPFRDILNDAMKLDFNKTFFYSTFNSTATETILSYIKQSIAESLVINCTTTNINNEFSTSNSCFKMLATKMHERFSREFGHWSVIVNIFGYGSYNWSTQSNALVVVFNNLIEVWAFQLL